VDRLGGEAQTKAAAPCKQSAISAYARSEILHPHGRQAQSAWALSAWVKDLMLDGRQKWPATEAVFFLRDAEEQP
jgi:hypothetical protein